MERKNGGKSLIYWLYDKGARQNSEESRKSQLRRIDGINTETVDVSFKLSRQKTDAMNLHQRPHLVYNLDETGLQLTCSSGNQKLLAKEGSKTVPTATHGRGNRDSSGLHGWSRWKQLIPPVVLYKGKHRREDFRDALSAGSTFSITPKGYITAEGFCKFLHHFNHHWLPGIALLILGGHRAYVDPSVLIEEKKLNIQLLCLPAHCSNVLYPLVIRSPPPPATSSEMLLEWSSGQLQNGES
jgi:hypothetical protein